MQELPLRANVRPALKGSFGRLVSGLVEGRWADALRELDAFQEAASVYLLARGNGTSVRRLRDVCYRLRLYLSEDRGEASRRRFIYEQLSELFRLFGRRGAVADPFLALAEVYRDLREDWLEFWARPSDDTLAPIIDDLEALDALEPSLREQEEDVYAQFRRILEARGRCFVSLPVMSALAKGLAGVREEAKAKAHEAFSSLFSEMEKLMAPYMFRLTPEGEGVRRLPVRVEKSGSFSP